jgi:hypothetical protein
MKKIFFYCFLIFLFACTQSYQAKIKNILSQNIQPIEGKVNKLSLGNTIVFQHEEKMGIDRSKYPLPKYEKNIDTNYFQYLKTETIADGSDGGTEYSFKIYKAIKAGNTKIDVYKMEDKQLHNPILNDTIAIQNKVLDRSYNFSISD